MRDLSHAGDIFVSLYESEQFFMAPNFEGPTPYSCLHHQRDDPAYYT